MKKLDSISPFIITPAEFNSILSTQPTEGKIIYIDWIHVKKDGIAIPKDKFIEAEYEMFGKSTQRCCVYKDNFYVLDGYYCYAYEEGEKPEFPDWWNYWISTLDKDGNSSYHGTKVVLVSSSNSSGSSGSFIDDLFHYKYTRKVKELSLSVTIDYVKLSRMKIPFPIPAIRTLEQMTADQLGSNVHNDTFKLVKTLIEQYVMDFSVPYPYQVCTENLPVLQDIVFYGCKTHDQVAYQEFSYTYKVCDIYVKVSVKKVGETEVLVNFKNITDITEDSYLTWTNQMNKECLGCIVNVYNESTYKEAEHD